MNIQINKERLENLKKAVKNTAKKLVIAGCIAGAIIAPATTVKAEAKLIDTSQGYYELSDDRSYLYADHLTSNELSRICKIPTIEEIHLYGTDITSCDFLNDNINCVTFEYCDIKNSISLPDTVTSLTINNSPSKEYNNINSNHLDELRFVDCDFDSLETISSIKSADDVTFDCCNIGDLTGIEKLNASNLSFYTTGIETIENLQNCYNLRNLTLSSTYVSDLTPLNGSKIECLETSDSPIESFDAVKNMPKLTKLVTGNNQMACTKDTIDYLKNHNITNTLSYDDVAIKEKVQEIAKSITNDEMSDKEKVKAIVDYVVDNIEYDYDVNHDDELLYEYNDHALKYALSGKGCCINYAMLTSALLNEANVKVYSQKNEGHIWNIVNVENTYYYIDSTFIDTDGLNKYNYMSSEEDFINAGREMTMPSSLYNSINNLTPKPFVKYEMSQTTTQTTEKSTTNDTVDKATIDSVSNELKAKNVAMGAIVGIATALGLAGGIKKFKSRKKEKELEETNLNQKL